MEKFQKYAVGDRLFIWYATSGSGKPFWWSTGVREYQIAEIARVVPGSFAPRGGPSAA